MQLVITVKDGATNKDIATQLRWQANLIDGMEPKEASKVSNTGKVSGKKAAPPVAVEDDDDDFKADDGGAEPAGFDDDAAEEETATEEEDFTAEEKPAPKKAAGKAKSKKITLDDVNDACKAHAQAKGRPATYEILKKKFKTQSVTALKPEQYEACISAMAVN